MLATYDDGPRVLITINHAIDLILDFNFSVLSVRPLHREFEQIRTEN